MVMAEISGKHGCGQFEAADGSENIAKAIDCKNLGKGKSNTASHSSNTEKSDVTLLWTPPSDHEGKVCTNFKSCKKRFSLNAQVTFIATVVGQNNGVSTWWENVKSKSFKI